MRKYCEEELAKVLPLLDEANKALEKIRQEDITLIRSFTQPPGIYIIVSYSWSLNASCLPMFNGRLAC